MATFRYPNIENMSINEIKGFIEGILHHAFELWDGGGRWIIQPDKDLGPDFIRGIMDLIEYYDLSPIEELDNREDHDILRDEEGSE